MRDWMLKRRRSGSGTTASTHGQTTSSVWTARLDTDPDIHNEPLAQFGWGLPKFAMTKDGDITTTPEAQRLATEMVSMTVGGRIVVKMILSFVFREDPVAGLFSRAFDCKNRLAFEEGAMRRERACLILAIAIILPNLAVAATKPSILKSTDCSGYPVVINGGGYTVCMFRGQQILLNMQAFKSLKSSEKSTKSDK